jgi:putative endonuclease
LHGVQGVVGSNPATPTRSTARPGAPGLAFFMNYYTVYILYSVSLDRYYVGQSKNHKERLEGHQYGRNKSTKAGVTWEIVHLEYFEDRPSAVRKERYIKNMDSRRYLERLIDQ